MLGKRFLAFMDNVDRLKKDGRLYLWTFTFAEAVDYTALRVAWNRLLTYLRRKLPDWAGVRIYEVHPGRWGISHGLHVHVTCNRRHDVNLVRAVARSAGWGRVHVVRLRAASAYYAGKYLAKMRRPAALRHWRLVGNFGIKGATRLADILVKSLRASMFRLGHYSGRFNGLPWDVKQLLVSRWVWQRVAGEMIWEPFSFRSSSLAFKRGKISGRSTYGDDSALIAGSRADFESRRRARLPRVLTTPLLPWGFTPRLRPDCSDTPAFNTCWGPDLRRSDLSANRAYDLNLLRSPNPF